MLKDPMIQGLIIFSYFHSGKITASGNVHGQDDVSQEETKESNTSLREMAAAQVDADPRSKGMEREKQISPDRQMILVGTGSAQTDGGRVSVEAEAPEKTDRMKPQPPGEQMEANPGSETTTEGR